MEAKKRYFFVKTFCQREMFLKSLIEVLLGNAEENFKSIGGTSGNGWSFLTGQCESHVACRHVKTLQVCNACLLEPRGPASAYAAKCGRTVSTLTALLRLTPPPRLQKQCQEAERVGVPPHLSGINA